MKTEKRYLFCHGQILKERHMVTVSSNLLNPESEKKQTKARITPYDIAASAFSAAMIRAMLTGLLFECPIAETSSSCHLCHVRAMPVRERVHWLQGLGDGACRKIYFDHLHCLETKI